MKKLVISLLITGSLLSTQAEAHWRGGHWIAPALIGGVIGYELAAPRYVVPPPVVYTQPNVVYVQPPMVTQIQTQPPIGYHWQQMIDPVTNQPKTVLVPN